MPKVNIYVPDDLYDEVRRRGLPMSALAQDAFRAALRVETNNDWIERARERRARTKTPFDTAALMDDVREEFGS